ncbi:ectoine hydroxylase [Kitasatospora nipponensis]|uniref:Ectoine hydroxylase n=1 Tax=Kitasatospora nipponensis TaxID=258049 RepID=A0ABP4GWK2_9ACTN
MLTESQVHDYRRDGHLLVENVFDAEEIALLRREVEQLYATDHPGRVFEKDGSTVRGIHGCHTTSALFGRLVQLPALLSAAEQLLESKVYVHQVKVNAKRALRGDVWQWHQDYIFWEQHDGVREPRFVNVALLLDDATEHNGPLLVVPGSHRSGVIRTERRAPVGAAVGAASGEEGAQGGESWAASLSAELDFALSAEQLAPLVAESGIRSLTGPAGSLLYFDSCIVHGSGANMSPEDRTMALVTYNSVDNEPVWVANPRPEFLAGRDLTPLAALEGGLRG